MFFSGADLLYRIPALLIALTFHEYAHARMAYAWGDATAKNAGRMTLNPISHLDPLGTLMVMLVGFGWARPVPINPFHFRHREKGLFWVSLAGPGTNLLLAFAAALVLFLTTGNLPSLYRWAAPGILEGILIWIVFINVFLAIFNFVPLPPLDGSKIVRSLLPRAYAHYYQSFEAYGPFLLILLLVLGLLPRVLLPIASFIIGGINALVLILTGQYFL